MTLDTRMEYYPRGLIISTGEHIPALPTSRLARIFPVPFEKGMVPAAKLTEFQRHPGVPPTARILRGPTTVITAPQAKACRLGLRLRSNTIPGRL